MQKYIKQHIYSHITYNTLLTIRLKSGFYTINVYIQVPTKSSRKTEEILLNLLYNIAWSESQEIHVRKPTENKSVQMIYFAPMTEWQTRNN